MIKNTAIILACSIIAKFLSYIWEATIASHLGVSENADAYYMAIGIFSILYPILDLGIWKVFLPIYKKQLVIGTRYKVDKIANVSITLFFCLSIGLVLFFILFANPLVTLMAPGFNDSKKLLSVEFLRIAALAYLLMTSSSILGAMLQSHESFFGSQLREVSTHISRIIFVYFFYDYFGVYSVVFAIIIGSIFRFIIQIPFVRWKWNFKFDFDFRNSEILPMLRGLPSVAVTAAIMQINGMVGRMFASIGTTGAVASLNYGNKLLNFFSGMISNAIAAASYPSIIQYITQKQHETLTRLVANIAIVLSFIIIPLTVFCIVYAKDLVQLAFQRGAFDDNATLLTSSIFAAYSIGMFCIGMTTIVSNIFYGFGDTKTTMYISFLDIFLNLTFNFAFYPIFGIVGIAFSNSLSAILSFSVRLYFLKRYVYIDFKRIGNEFGKVFVFSIIAIACSHFINIIIPQFSIVLKVLCVSFLSTIIFLSLSIVFELQAILILKRIIANKLR